MVNYHETLLTEGNRIPPKTFMAVEREIVHVPAQGIGINITLDGQAKGCYPEDEAGWQALLSHLAALSPNWLCITLPAQEVLTEEGALRTEAPELGQLDRFCKWACERQADVVLMFPKSVPAWMRFQGAASQPPAPRDPDAYGEMVAEAMRHFVVERGYRCLKYSTIFGEPFNEDGEEFSFGTPSGIDPYAYYVKVHAAVRAALDRRGLESVGLLGPNSADVYAHLETFKRADARQLDITAHTAAIDLHAYRMRFDYMPSSHHIFTCGLTEYLEVHLRQTLARAEALGKPCFITELGCMYYGKSRYGDNRGPARHECFIAEAELILRSLNMGIDGILKWVLLFDTTELRGHYHLLELSGGGYLRKDNFHGYSLLNRCMPKGSKILELKTEGQGAGVYASAVESPDGDLSIMIVNEHPCNLVDVEIQPGQAFGSRGFSSWVVDAWDKGLCKGGVARKDGRLGLRLTPLSLTVVTTMSL